MAEVKNKLTNVLKKSILKSQRNEITEHLIYKKLAQNSENKNKEILEKISSDELSHYNILSQESLSQISWRMYIGSHIISEFTRRYQRRRAYE